jgi:hypothetical protein
MARIATALDTTGKKPKKWSAAVMQKSDALDLEQGVFTKPSAWQIATSLKRSAERSKRRKGSPFQSAMSMLNFHINRAGKSLTGVQRTRLERAKDELRTLFGKTGQRKKKPSGSSRYRHESTTTKD